MWKEMRSEGDPETNRFLRLHRVRMRGVCKWRWVKKVGGKD